MKKRLEDAGGYPQVFSLVKEATQTTLGARRAGIMLGLAELGVTPQGFIGAYHPVDTNIIVLNRNALEMVAREKPGLTKAYTFHLLLHEYIHTLGVYDEAQTRQMTLQVCSSALGETHPATRMSRNLLEYFPDLQPEPPRPQWGSGTGAIELIPDIDEESRKYYA